jgi:hypothetical protein
MTRARKFLVFDCPDVGLANRLRAYVGLRALADVWSTDLYLHWPISSACDAAFESLFESANINMISARDVTRLARHRNAIVVRSADWFGRIWESYGRTTVSRAVFASAVAQAMGSLRPITAIRDRVEQHASKWQLQSATGFHIRHTDNLESYAYWAEQRRLHFKIERISTLEGFARKLDQTCVGHRCFLATDNAEVERAFLASRTAKIVTLANKFGAKNKVPALRTTPVETALCELLLLARCRRIIGTYYSSFSKFAAILGGAEYLEIRGRRAVRNRGVDRMQYDLGVGQPPRSRFRRWSRHSDSSSDPSPCRENGAS